MSHSVSGSDYSLGSTGSDSSASTAKTHSCTRHSGSPATSRSSASRPSAYSRAASDLLVPRPRPRSRSREDRAHPQPGQRLRAIRLLGDLRLVDGIVDRGGRRVVHLGQPGQDRGLHPGLVGQVAPGDQVAFGVPGEPAAARADQLVHLVGGHPVVLRVVEHGQEHVQVVERLGQPQAAREPQVDVRGFSPAGELRVQRHRGRGHLPAQRREQLSGQRGTAAAGQGGHVQVKRNRGRGQLRPGVTPAGHCGPEHLGQRHRQHAGRRVRAVVHVLAQGEGLGGLPAGAPDERDRIHVEQQRCRAPAGCRFGVEDMRLPRCDREAVHLLRMLVQQEAQVGGWIHGGGDGDKHSVSLLAATDGRKSVSALIFAGR
jgi:hypothetical protein